MTGFQRIGPDQFSCAIGGECFRLRRSEEGEWVLAHSVTGGVTTLDHNEATSAFWLGQLGRTT